MEDWWEKAIEAVSRNQHDTQERVENLEREVAELSSKLEAVSRAILATKAALTAILRAPLDKAGVPRNNEGDNEPPRLAASMDS